MPAIDITSEIAQQSNAVRFARIALLHDGNPLLLHIVGQIPIVRNRILNLYQPANDFAAQCLLIVHVAPVIDVVWRLVFRRHMHPM